MNFFEQKTMFSIITCTYNSQEYLKKCIKSVENQDFKDFEHLFIDAFSTDHTVSIIKDYQSRHPDKVRLIQQEPKGVSNAMNVGIHNSQGQIIVHLHSDDFLFSNEVLSMVEKKFRNTNITVVVGNCVYKKNEIFTSIWPKNKLFLYLVHKFMGSYLFLRNGIPHPSTYIRKDVFERHGLFLENLKTVMDYEFWFRILKKERILYLNDNLSVYRVHDNTISNQNVDIAKKEIKEIYCRYKMSYMTEFVFSYLIIKPIIILFKYFKK